MLEAFHLLARFAGKKFLEIIYSHPHGKSHDSPMKAIPSPSKVQDLTDSSNRHSSPSDDSSDPEWMSVKDIQREDLAQRKFDPNEDEEDNDDTPVNMPHEPAHPNQS